MAECNGQAITLCYYLSNCIQALRCTASFMFIFNEENRNRTKHLEIILHLPLVVIQSSRTDSRWFLKAKSNTATRQSKIWGQILDLDCRMKSWLTVTGERNRDVASAILCSIRRPYCTSIISISCAMDLKNGVGMRERWSSKVAIYLMPQACSPMNEAIDSYLRCLCDPLINKREF